MSTGNMEKQSYHSLYNRVSVVKFAFAKGLGVAQHLIRTCDLKYHYCNTCIICINILCTICICMHYASVDTAPCISCPVPQHEGANLPPIELRPSHDQHFTINSIQCHTVFDALSVATPHRRDA